VGLTQTLRLVVNGDSKGATRALDGLAGKARNVGKKLDDVGKKWTKNVTLPIVGGMAASVMAASNLEEAMNKTDVVFGKAAKSVHAFAEDASTTMGQSQAQAEAAASSFGNLFKTMGIGQGKAAKMSLEMVKLASDLASFHNIGIDEALEKLQSGLVGEAEPMRQLGVLLSEAAVKQEAYRMGLAKTGDELTEQQKVAARYSLIMQQTKDAQGDFARTSDSLANKMKTLKAKFTDVGAKLGTALMPMVEKLADAVERVADWFGNLTDSQRKWLVKAALVLAAIGPMASIFGRLATGIGKAAKAYQWLTTVQTTMTGTGFFQAGKWNELSKSSSRFATILGRIGKTAGALGLVAAAGYGIFEAFKRIDQEAGFQQFGQFFKDFGLSGEREFKRTVENYARMARKIENDPVDIRVKTDEANRKLNATLATWERIKRRAGGPLKFTADDSNLLATMLRIQTALAETSRQARRTAQEIAGAIAQAGGHTGWKTVPLASGGDFVTAGPTRLLVGEAGPERVTVNPLTGPNAGRYGGGIGGNVTIPIYLDGREIAAYTVDIMSGNARRLARGMA